MTTVRPAGDNRRMKEKEPDKSRTGSGCGAVAVLLILVCLPCIYVLAIGPLVPLADAGLLGGEATTILQYIYSPLSWVYERSSVVQSALDWYIGLWSGLAPSQPALPPPTAPPVPTTPTPALPPGS